MVTWHKTNQAKIENWLETLNRQKFKISCSNFISAQIISLCMVSKLQVPLNLILPDPREKST